jgi:hypothetical protein
MNKTNSADLNDFSNFHSLYFSVGHVLMLAKSFEKEVESFGEGGKLGDFTVLLKCHERLLYFFLFFYLAHKVRND